MENQADLLCRQPTQNPFVTWHTPASPSFKLVSVQAWRIFLLHNNTASVSCSLKQASLRIAETSSRTQGKIGAKGCPLARLSTEKWRRVSSACACFSRACEHLTVLAKPFIPLGNKPAWDLGTPVGKHTQRWSSCTIPRGGNAFQERNNYFEGNYFLLIHWKDTET